MNASEYSVLSDGEWRIISFDEFITHLINEGWQDDEIIDRLGHPKGLRAARDLRRHVAGLRGPGPVPLDAALIAAYRRCKARRPKQLDVAGEMGYESEDPVRDALRKAGIPDYRKIHALIAALPEGASGPE